MPFRLQPGRKITDLSTKFAWRGRDISIEEDEPYYVIRVDKFHSEEEAGLFIDNLTVALTWLLLRRGIAADFRVEIQETHIASDPEAAAQNLSKSFGQDYGQEVHGKIDAGRPAIFGSDLNIRRVKANGIGGVTSNAGASLVDDISVALAATAPARKLSNEKLATAIELYRAYHSESTPRAKFLTLIMALESMVEPAIRPPAVQTLIGHFLEEIEEYSQSTGLDDEVKMSLKSLARELDFRRGDSIRGSVRNLIYEVLSDDVEVSQLAKEAVDLYDKRSTLVHKGSLPAAELGEAITSGSRLVQRMLTAEYAKVVGIEEHA